jgi:branched-chain amino acid transport system ATP-binding protein
MLEVRDLEAGYGPAQVLNGVSLTVAPGEVVTLLGRNGMGKTTTVRCIMGLLRPRAGRVRFRGEPITGWPSHRIARLGIGLVPEGRQVFPNLTVREHLLAFARKRAGRGSPDEILEVFPGLQARAASLAGRLSGGEQQMLAIARALVIQPHLLILDEATEGLAPLVREEIWRCIERLKADGQAILIIDKPHRALDRLADRMLVMEKGRIGWQGRPAELHATGERRRQLLGV